MTATAAAGTLTVIKGCMFSGKTTELCARVVRARIANKSCAVLRYLKDDRFKTGNVVTCHDRKTQVDATHASETMEPFMPDFLRAEDPFDVIAVDEVQFFPDAVACISRLLAAGKNVVVSGLSATAQRKPWAVVADLEALGPEETVIKTAVCMLCFGTAHSTRKLGGAGKNDAVTDIGGEDKYMAVCRTCFDRQNPRVPERKRKSPSTPTMIAVEGVVVSPKDREEEEGGEVQEPAAKRARSS